MGRFEIDLIGRKAQVVSFVEVKTRLSRAFGSPLEAVTNHKQREIARVAHAWVDRYGTSGDHYRFDVIGVTLERGRRPKIEHVPDAFWPGWR
jgi:putative endonuclease